MKLKYMANMVDMKSVMLKHFLISLRRHIVFEQWLCSIVFVVINLTLRFFKLSLYIYVRAWRK